MPMPARHFAAQPGGARVDVAASASAFPRALQHYRRRRAGARARFISMIFFFVGTSSGNEM